MLKLVSDGNRFTARAVMFEAKLNMTFWTWRKDSEHCQIHITCDETGDIGTGFICLSDDGEFDEYKLLKKVIGTVNGYVPNLGSQWLSRKRIPNHLEGELNAYLRTYRFLYRLNNHEANGLISK